MKLLKTANNRVVTCTQYLLLFILVYFVVFLKLGSFSLRWWDESMFAVNTYEMMANGKWFSFYFDNNPDLYNTKPPLVCWAQMLSAKLLGYNELALRLPSAMAAALTIMVLFRFVARNFNGLWAWISVLVLMTSSGFIHFHTARTAESDAVLTLFLLLANLAFVQFIFTKDKKYILPFFIAVTLAFATKLYAAFLFVPAYLFFLFFKALFKRFFLCWQCLVGIVTFVTIVGSLLYLREVDTPGYLSQIINKDAGRIVKAVENHGQPLFFYFDGLFFLRFSIWFVFFMIGGVLTLLTAKGKERDILLLFLSFILVYLGIIMSSVTKLIWYDMPLFPYLSVIAAYPIYLLIKGLRINEKPLTGLSPYLIIGVVFIYPYSIAFRKSQANTIENGEKELEANEIYLHKEIRKKKDLDGIKVFYTGWKGSLLFYQYKLAERNEFINLVANVEDIEINDKVLVCNDSLRTILSNKFYLTAINKENNAVLYRVDQKKSDPLYGQINDVIDAN